MVLLGVEFVERLSFEEAEWRKGGYHYLAFESRIFLRDVSRGYLDDSSQGHCIGRE